MSDLLGFKRRATNRARREFLADPKTVRFFALLDQMDREVETLIGAVGGPSTDTLVRDARRQASRDAA